MKTLASHPTREVHIEKLGSITDTADNHAARRCVGVLLALGLAACNAMDTGTAVDATPVSDAAPASDVATVPDATPVFDAAPVSDATPVSDAIPGQVPSDAGTDALAIDVASINPGPDGCPGSCPASASADADMSDGADAATSDCAAPNVLCDDFDQGTLGLAKASKRWTENSLSSLSAHGSAFIDNISTDGGPAIHVRLSDSVPEDGVVGMLRENLGTSLGLSSTGTVTIEFDFRAVGDPIYPFGLFCGSDNYQISFNLDQNRVSEQNGQVPHGYAEFARMGLPDPANGTRYFAQWRHIVLILNRGARTLSMKVDNLTILDSVYLHGNVSTGSCTFGLGVFWAAKDGEPLTWDGYYDHVHIKTSS